MSKRKSFISLGQLDDYLLTAKTASVSVKVEGIMATSSVVPQELDWVSRRAACTIARVFNQLCDGIKRDVKTLNAVRGEVLGDAPFAAEVLSSGRAIVIGQPNRIPKARVTVSVGDDCITVTDERVPSAWTVTLGLNHEGRCVLRLKDYEELEQWQFRKRALQGLFFGKDMFPNE